MQHGERIPAPFGEKIHSFRKIREREENSNDNGLREDPNG